MKVALIHDWLTGMRGGERVLEVFCELFPDAKIFTLLYIAGRLTPRIEGMEIETSFIDRLPFSSRIYRHYLPLFPAAVELFDLRGYDLIISISHCVAKGIISPPSSLHICYCLTPMRYAWDQYHHYFGEDRLGFFSRKIVPLFMNYLRTWDVASSRRVDLFVASSKNVKRRIRKYYRREAEVIHPPVDTDFFTPGGEDGGYFLLVSALVPYKRVDLAVATFNQLGLPLLIVGEGPESRRLRKMAKENIRFLGRVSDEKLRELYRGCRALIFPAEEDFGIAPLEAQACGRPVIAYGKGGVLETVIPEETGVLFPEQSVPAMVSAVDKFQRLGFNKEVIRKNALRFSPERFKEGISTFIKEGWERHLKEGEK
ncbi:MAG: glycosyltransferase [Acidobacteria bacterium]|nr:glycosyltransferase [Acidobacteriota bacterium]